MPASTSIPTTKGWHGSHQWSVTGNWKEMKPENRSASPCSKMPSTAPRWITMPRRHQPKWQRRDTSLLHSVKPWLSTLMSTGSGDCSKKPLIHPTPISLLLSWWLSSRRASAPSMITSLSRPLWEVRCPHLATVASFPRLQPDSSSIRGISLESLLMFHRSQQSNLLSL